MPETASGVSLIGKRVLIIEDEGIIQMHLRKILSKAGLEVVGSATNGKAGVEIALRENPDIILMDITMPVMNGLEATRRIREHLSSCVVILTAYADEDYEQAAWQAGASGYLNKPIIGELLLPSLIEVYWSHCTAFVPIVNPVKDRETTH